MNDKTVLLQVDMPESARRHLRSVAAALGITMGQFITDMLIAHAGYLPPKPLLNQEDTNGTRS
jgi:hypothetical protein